MWLECFKCKPTSLIDDINSDHGELAISKKFKEISSHVGVFESSIVAKHAKLKKYGIVDRSLSTSMIHTRHALEYIMATEDISYHGKDAYFRTLTGISGLAVSHH